MKTTVKFLLAAALTMAVAHATPFDFSYTFDLDGTQATGSFDGTQTGNLVDNISNVSLFLNGVQVTGPIFTAQADPDLGFINGGVASFDVTLNNFFFVNSDYVGFDFSYTGYFGIFSGSALAFSDQVGFPADSPPVAENWSLTSQSVPDTGSTAALLGLAAVGLVWVRRRSLQAA